MMKRGKQLLGMALIIIMAFIFATCAEAEDGVIYSDIIAGIDYDSVVVDGDATFFSSVMSDGTVVRFEGTNISIDADGVTLKPESAVTSLDAVGTIYVYQASVKDGEQSPIGEQWLDIGYGYTNSADRISMERASDVYADALMGYSAAVWNDDVSLSIADFEPNFVFIKSSSGNTADITVTSLTIGYDPSQKFTDIEVARRALPDYFVHFEAFFETADTVYEEEHEKEYPESYEEVYENTDPIEIEKLSENVLDESKTAESGVIYSDIIAGIDYDSISVDGDVTFFSSVMSDGAVVRFEGKNISITDEGITMNLNGSVTSLDAVGKIYEYSGDVKDKDEAYANDQWISIGYGYTFSADKISVERASEVLTHSLYLQQASTLSPELTVSVASYEPNFVYVETADYNTAAFTLTSLTIGYNPAEKVTAITDLELYAYRYGYYMEGEPYDYAKEDKADEEAGEYDFYLQLKLEVLDEYGTDDCGYNENWMWFLPNDFYEVGDLKDADGNVLDKETARIHEGYTLDVSVGDYDFTLELPMAELYTGAQTLKEARPYSTLTAVGEQNALVVPVVWADQTDLVSDELYALYQKELGRLIDAQGNPIGDFSDANDEVFSLTEYFDAASYGRLKLSSFMTDWYYTDKTFAGDYEYIFPEINFADEVLRWVKATYPDTDWTQFDRDGDGAVDAIVFISVGLSQDESYMPASFGGAVHSTGNSYGKLAGTREDPQANCFLTVNHSFLMDGKINTLIHEFSHNFGLNDYYDTSYSGVDAVGGYDMEGSNAGDWNAYSKLAAGWIEPQIVSGLASGESVELTIGSLALTDDVIVLPAAGAQYGGPFGEYVTIDLLSPDGVNAYDAAEYGLESTVGVRISHVNANMRSVTESDGVLGEIEDNGNVIGMELHSNSYDETFGIYNVEVIQSGGENTFTNLDNLMPTLRAEDLFYEGDTFTAAAYDQFFYHGLMDNGMELGYRVDILSIGTDAEGNPTATVRITAD